MRLEKTKKIVLYGAGGMGREITRLIARINAVKPTFELVGFIDDTENMAGKMVAGYKVLGNFEELKKIKYDVFCCCTIGFANTRERIYKKLKDYDIKTLSLIDPSVIVEPSSKIGNGTIIQHDSCISVDVSIGKGCFFNAYTDLGHDVVIGDYCVCNPRVQVSGKCKVGNTVSIGGMSFLNPKVRVGDNVVIAPMSCVYGKVKAGTHVLGNPARRIEL